MVTELQMLYAPLALALKTSRTGLVKICEDYGNNAAKGTGDQDLVDLRSLGELPGTNV